MSERMEWWEVREVVPRDETVEDGRGVGVSEMTEGWTWFCLVEMNESRNDGVMVGLDAADGRDDGGDDYQGVAYSH